MKTKTNIIYLATALFAVACFALSPKVQAVSPAPDGCYPGFTTAEGCNALSFLTTGAGNTGLGWESLLSDTTGGFNTSVGAGALILNNGDSNTAVGAVALLLNTTGTENTAVGTDAMVYNDTGNNNTAVGAFALFTNTISSGNTAVGTQALYNSNQTDLSVDAPNTALGFQALYSNTTGNENTATGYQALFSSAEATDNTADGSQALYSNTAGYANTATGSETLYYNTTGFANTATGFQALFSNVGGTDPQGSYNTATGFFALGLNTTGWSNTATGAFALNNILAGYGNAAYGNFSLGNSQGSRNIGIGLHAGCVLNSGDDNILIGNVGVDGESNTIRIGTPVSGTNCIGGVEPAHTATYIAGIFGATASAGSTVYVTSDGHLGTMTSSARFKEDIRPMDKTSEAILALKPVTFRYKHELDPKANPQFGLVAEDVANVNPDLVVRDADGKAYTVRYEAVNAMLLNEFLKAHRRIEEQDKRIDQLTAQLKEQAALIEKVNDKVELNRSAPETVLNNQ
ncbi:MAG TPA: tail fiber domain-containing protein [Candidatus Udaeobacter sp.]